MSAIVTARQAPNNRKNVKTSGKIDGTRSAGWCRKQHQRAERGDVEHFAILDVRAGAFVEEILR